MKEPEFDPILKKHIFHLASTHPFYTPDIQSDNHDYQNTKRKREDRLFSLPPKRRLKETNETESISEDESIHHSLIFHDEQASNHN